MNTYYRPQLIQLFHEAIHAVKGEVCVAHWLRQNPIKGPVHLLAIGKAADSMVRGALQVLPQQIEDALVITKVGHCGDFAPRIHCVEASHPLPDQTSLAAGRQLLHFIQAIPPHSQTLVLISGGASALVEVLPEDISLGEWQRATQWLLSHDYSIVQINAVRKRLSCIKAGRLAHYFADRRAICLLISDVPGNDPAVIGSGLLVPDKTNVSDLGATDWMSTLPAHIIDLLNRAPASPASNDSCFRSIRVEIVATLQDAKKAVHSAAQKLGLDSFFHEEFIAGDAAQAGRRLARRLLQGPPGLHIWGGETTVTLPEHPGRGGRSQTLALAAAQELADIPKVLLLAAGTDGTDGPGDVAGAIVDGGTQARGLRNLGAQTQPLPWYLEHADAGTFLQASGDLVRTGPTGTNVMDVVLGLKWDATD